MTKKKNWIVQISQNGWEYCGHCSIKAVKVEQVGRCQIIADGIEITFDEEIKRPYFEE